MLQTLAKKARQGDPEAFIALMEACKGDLYRAAKGYLSNDEDVADVMQDTALAAFEHISELKNPRYVKTWLTRILLNRCAAVYRQNRQVLPLAEDYEPGAPDDGQGQVETEELFSHLSPQYRTVLALHQQGYKAREIAELLQCSTGTVTSRLKRGREQLKRLYEEEPS